jgi:hypothetical protein
MNANRSQSPCERVSVLGDKICRERVCASQRPGGILPPRSAVSRSRDRRLRSGPRECRGKPGVFPETARNRLIARLRGGDSKTRTACLLVMGIEPVSKRSNLALFPRIPNGKGKKSGWLGISDSGVATIPPVRHEGVRPRTDPQTRSPCIPGRNNPPGACRPSLPASAHPGPRNRR